MQNTPLTDDAISDEPIEQDAGALTELERQEAIVRIERGEADLAAGRVCEVRDAFEELGEKRGYTVKE